MLRHQRIDRGNAGNVDNGQFGARLDNALQQVLHDHLSASAV